MAQLNYKCARARNDEKDVEGKKRVGKLCSSFDFIAQINGICVRKGSRLYKRRIPHIAKVLQTKDANAHRSQVPTPIDRI